MQWFSKSLRSVFDYSPIDRGSFADPFHDNFDSEIFSRHVAVRAATKNYIEIISLQALKVFCISGIEVVKQTMKITTEIQTPESDDESQLS